MLNNGIKTSAHNHTHAHPHHHKVVYKKLEPDLVGKATDCIGVSFATNADPFTRAFGLSQAQWGVMSQMFVQRAAKKDLSWVAFNEQTGRVEGVIINEDWKEKQPSEYRNLLDWAPVRAMFNELHTRFKANHPRIDHGKVIHPLYFTSVRPEARRSGIVSTLWEKSVETARDKNYETMVAEAGNNVSAAVFTKLGFEEVAKVNFDEFSYQKDRPFTNLHKQDGFDKLSIFKRSITSNLYV